MKQEIEDLKRRMESFKDVDGLVTDTEERVIIIDNECKQTIKDLKMAHARDIAKLTRDMRDNYQK